MGNQLIEKACEITLQNTEFEKDLIQLTRNELSEHIENLSEVQVSRLLEASSLFALSENSVHQKLAFKTAVYLLNQYKSKYVLLPFAIEIILTRLGDLPAIRSMIQNRDGQDYFSFFENEQMNYSTFITNIQFPEILNKKLVNRIQVTEKESIALTDFQARIYYLLREGSNVAFSAPTSTGKSYVIHNYIAERIMKSNKFCAVYIAPTKALIAEIQKGIRDTIINLGVKPSEFGVFISANFLNLAEANATPKKVFVLTQERLQDAMANNPLLDVDLLVVDEAHKISEENRGIIIEDAVHELLSMNQTEHQVQKVFISPYVKNLDKFQSVFDISDEIKFEKTSKSPVGQIFLFVDFKKRQVSVSLLWHDLKDTNNVKLISLDRKEAPRLPTYSGRKAWVALNLIPSGEPTLIYCNKPADCRLVAKHIAVGRPTEPKLPKELSVAIEFFSEHVHKEYYLCDSIVNRVGYHYGKMPQFVRFQVKRLFENRDIDRLCCTSTLLEGVNLPAKNIILYNPRAGKIMNRLSLLNLAGRAGRLLKDYYGKIFCIDMKDWQVGEDVFEDRLENIESSVEKTLEEKATSLMKYLENEKAPATDGVKALATSLMMKYLKDPNSNFLKNFEKRHKQISPVNLKDIEDKIIMVTPRLFLDKSVILKNRSFDPRYQNELYLSLKSDYEPVPFPNDPKLFEKLCFIFEKISRILFREESKAYRYYSLLACKWIREEPYRSILEGKIDSNRSFKKKQETEKAFINRMIEDLDEDIETKI